jgi:hypothetical protein
MRYLKATSSKIIDVDIIAGEMINIAYKKTYYIDGKPNPDLQNASTDCNIYNIDDVEYDIHPNIGTLILLMNEIDQPTMMAAIKSKYQMFEQVLSFTYKVVPDIGNAGTTQYLAVQSSSSFVTPTTQFIEYTHNNIPSIISSYDFIFCWYVTSDADLPISYFNSLNYLPHQVAMSLSSIIYDELNVLNLPHMYKHACYPEIKDYTAYTNGEIIEKNITILNLGSGLHGEIFKLCGSKFISANKIQIYHEQAFPTTHKLNWIKWKDLKLYVVGDSAFDPVEQINRGILDDNSQLTLNDESEMKSKSYTCFMTGIPIYEDCYVFDIYEQTMTETIDVLDLDKYPDATIVNDLDKSIVDECNDEAGEETDYLQNEPFISAVERTTIYSKLRPYICSEFSDDRSLDDFKAAMRVHVKSVTFGAGKPISKKMMEAIMDKIVAHYRAATNNKAGKVSRIKAIKKTKKITEPKETKKTKKVTETKKTKKVNEPNETKEIKELIVTTKKMPLKRGQTKVTEMIKIQRTIKYQTPKHVLISPVYVHYHNINTIKKFEDQTNTKVLVYRTFCPTTLHSVINNIDKNTITKSHRQFLHEFNEYASAAGKGYSTKNVDLYSDIFTQGIVNKEPGKIIGYFSKSFRYD